MKASEVPQQPSELQEGLRRALYAADETGKYMVVPSAGWHVEQIVNDQAHEVIRHAVEEARQLVAQGKASPLLCHMARCQMTAGLLAQTAGFWRWQVYRHLKPNVFARLDKSILLRYADALRMTVEELCAVPKEP
jgi:hypothetical protein